ncbi:MAG: YkgJ family cysteine cluster protein [bacterium]
MFKDYIKLLDKIDSFTEGVRKRHPESFECAPGCSGCCVAGITVWRVEADHIRKCAGPLGERTASASGDRCSRLNDEGLCSIYQARPAVCRLWGAALLIPKGREGEWGLRPSSTAHASEGAITCCSLNFREGVKLSELPSSDLINAETAVSTLAAINHVYCKAMGLDPTERLAV